VTGDLDALAEGLWRRMRDAVLAARRLDGFSFTEEPGPPGWVEGLPADPSLDEAALDLTRRALAAGADGWNHRLLARLAADGGGTVGGLAAALGLSPLAVAERISDLAQVGLAAHVVERGTVRATAAGEAWVRLVAAVGAGIHARARQELPALVAGSRGAP
jgi:hypothetical protein